MGDWDRVDPSVCLSVCSVLLSLSTRIVDALLQCECHLSQLWCVAIGVHGFAPDVGNDSQYQLPNIYWFTIEYLTHISLLIEFHRFYADLWLAASQPESNWGEGVNGLHVILYWRVPLGYNREMIHRARCCHGNSSVCSPVRLSVTKYCNHIGWNSSKIISRPSSLWFLVCADPNM